MIIALDRLLGRITMYRLVLLSLLVIAVVAITMGATGVLAFSPLAMLASLAVTGIAAHGTNLVAARIARVSPHHDSTSITALLLFFLLPPTLDPLALAMTAVAAVVAAASKYLLAVRGRHVLNPAAAGVFVVGLFGLAYATWWVGTPPLLPFVAIAALAILVRTRHLPLGLVAIGVATAVYLVRFALDGADPLSALTIAFGSTALVFAVGFMVSEPLTLPPRRHQQIAIAVLFALLFAVPFSTGVLALGPVTIGPLSSTPELALIVGNLVGFLLGQRRGIRLELVSTRQLTPTSWEFELRPLAPVRFSAGQFIELSMPHRRSDRRGARRVFSIASAAGDTIRIGVRSTEPVSSFKRRLLALEPGSRLAATSVGGDFVLPRDPGTPLLLVAGGIGITPFIGHLAELAAEARERDAAAPDVVVVYAVSANAELAYLGELERSGVRVVVASPEEPAGMPEGWRWIGPSRLTAEAILAAVPDASERTSYLSGPPSLVAELRRALRRAGVRRLRTDVFLGY